MGLPLLLLRFLCALAHALGEVWDVCVRWKERQVEWEQPWCVVVVRQISEGDGVSVCGGCGRER